MRVLLAVATLLVASGCEPLPSEIPITPKVLLVGVDGVRPDLLRRVPTPNIDRLIEAGAFSDQAQTGRPTVSGPGWSSMLIGAWPEKHGVHSNDFSTNRYAEFPDFLTRIETVRPELNTFAATDWLPLSTEESGGPLITGVLDSHVILDGYELGWLEADSTAVAAAIGEITTGDPDALFVYLGAPDEISHSIGGLGEEYLSAIETADRHVGKLVAAIRGRPSFQDEDWLILVSTDHGRTEAGGHGGDSPEETTIFYLVSGPAAQVGRLDEAPAIVDVPVTALAHLGIPIDPAWELDGRVIGLRAFAADTLRILAYNTHHGEGLDEVLDLERIAEVIRAERPDLVALQEIDRTVERTGGVDQAEVYGDLAGLDPLFGEFMEYQGGHYGMALLSGLPILISENYTLPPGAEPRSALTATVRLPRTGRSLTLAGIHFYRSEEERLAQARSLLATLDGLEPLAILAGDFNSTSGSAVMELLGAEFDIPQKTGLPNTFPADGPEREIDFILLRPSDRFRVLDYRVLDEAVASDHRPILMVVEVG